MSFPFFMLVGFADILRQYSRNKKRIIIEDDILYRQNYNDLSEISHLQVLLPGQLLKVLLQSKFGTAGKHAGNSKKMQKNRQKYYVPSIATYVTNWVCDCEICIQDKRIISLYANRPFARITAKWV